MRCVDNCSGATGARTAAGYAVRRCLVNIYELWSTAVLSSRLHLSLTTHRLGNHPTVLLLLVVSLLLLRDFGTLFH